MNVPKSGKLDFFGDLYTRAKAARGADDDRFSLAKRQYDGDDEIDGSSERASYVRNITYEIIESQIDTSVPAAKVSPEVLSEGNTRNAASLERLLNGIRDRLPFEQYNDLDERRAYVYGASVWLVEWDESIATRTTAGDVKITLISPEDFFPQPNIDRVEDMDYLFLRYVTTRDDLRRRYGEDIDLTEAAVDAGEVTADAEDDDTVSLIICYYIDGDGLIGRYAWSGSVELEDIGDYYSRKIKVCRRCGRKEALCRCENPDLEEESSDFEELSEDIQLPDGKIIPAMSPALNDDGTPKTKMAKKPIIDEATGMPIYDSNGEPMLMDVEEIVMEPTRIEYYKPRHLPVAIRRNIPLEGSPFGVSDCLAIRAQQQAINKVESRIMQKLMKASVMPVMPEGAMVSRTNSVFGEIIKLSPGENRGDYGTIDTTPNIQQDIAEAERIYDTAKRIVGITDSYQGQADTTAKSGKAKQIQVAQAAGRLASKRVQKQSAYADIDRVIAEYYLAYADEPRPASYRDMFGQVQNEQFNRYAFVEYDDKSGTWYVDDRYRFSTDASSMEEDRQSMWELINNMRASGAYGDPASPITMLMYWKQLEKYHFPGASENAAYFEQMIRSSQDAVQRSSQVATADSSAGGSAGNGDGAVL